MGLAAVHVAQVAEAKWRTLKGAGKTAERPFTWKELFSIAVRYRQLVDPEEGVFWISSLPSYHAEEGMCVCMVSESKRGGVGELRIKNKRKINIHCLKGLTWNLT
jgi:hypothetical protein